MGADQTLQVNVVTGYDGTGMKALAADSAKINSDIASQLAAAGARFDPISKSFQSIKSGADDAAKSTAGIGDSALFAGAHLNKAVSEATVLARELATGSFNARTLGSFLGALGPAMTVAGIAGIGIFEAIKRASDEQNKWVT